MLVIIHAVYVAILGGYLGSVVVFRSDRKELIILRQLSFSLITQR